MSISSYITNWLVTNAYAREDEKEIVEFGIEQILLTLLNLVTVLILGTLFGALIQSVIFFIAFVSLRSYAGGYHAATRTRCYLISVAALLTSFLSLKVPIWTMQRCIAVTILAGVVLLLLAPVGNPNKEMEEIEIKVYRKRSIYIYLIQAGIIFGSLGMNISFIYQPMVLSMMIIMALMISGKVKLHKSQSLDR